MNSRLRNDLVLACHDYLQAKVNVVKNAMDSLKDDLDNESKSSAGDKYETGREMINIEWNKLSVQLNEYDRLEQILNRIEEHNATGNVALGSVVITDAANYFIAIPAGQLNIVNSIYFAVGIKAPIAQMMLGKRAGDQITFNGSSFTIQEII